MPRGIKKGSHGIQPAPVQEEKENAKSPSPAPEAPIISPPMPENPILPSGKPIKIKNKGSKEEVYNGLAKCTGGGLQQQDLMLNAKGNIISKKKHELGKKNPKPFHKKEAEEIAASS